MNKTISFVFIIAVIALSACSRNNDSASWNRKGNALYREGRYAEAINCYDKAIEIYPESFNAWIGKADILKAMDRHAEAIKCYEKAIEIYPESFTAWTSKADTLRAMGRYEEASECYIKAKGIEREKR